MLNIGIYFNNLIVLKTTMKKKPTIHVTEWN